MISRSDKAQNFRTNYYNEKSTQYEMCAKYLEMHGEITPLEALEAFGCFRLSAIIFVLRNCGWKIRTDINDGKKKYAVYVLEEEGDEE